MPCVSPGNDYLEQCESKHYLFSPVDIKKLNDEGQEGKDNLVEWLERTRVYLLRKHL